MIDIGYKIPQIGQYIMYILGGLLILAGVIMALIYIISSRKAHKLRETHDEIFEKYQEKQHEEMEEVIGVKSRRRRSNKY